MFYFIFFFVLILVHVPESEPFILTSLITQKVYYAGRLTIRFKRMSSFKKIYAMVTNNVF